MLLVLGSVCCYKTIIPDSWGTLSLLQGLSPRPSFGGFGLNQNQLGGQIPRELGSLANLTHLHLGYNRLSGKLPHDLTRLSLAQLHYGDNGGLCASAGDVFRKWLNGVPSRSGPICPPIHASDRAALVALYEATDGSHWGNNANWLSDEPLDSWYGVTTDHSGRISTLVLVDVELRGTIPADLGSLANLYRLNLSHNQLSGQIPSQLRSLANLTRLHLGYNRLSGQIPSQLGSLTNLESLNLSNNRLSRQIPSELGSLANLTHLHLGYNRLSGQIPPELASVLSLKLAA